jgi:hypothetical protein
VAFDVGTSKGSGSGLLAVGSNDWAAQPPLDATSEAGWLLAWDSVVVVTLCAMTSNRMVGLVPLMPTCIGRIGHQWL